MSFKVGANTTHLETQCLCNHLTFFGNSFFVTPNLVDPSRTAELFATFADNPVVVCFIAALFLAYLLVLVWARRKDIRDTVKVLHLSWTEEWIKNNKRLVCFLGILYILKKHNNYLYVSWSEVFSVETVVFEAPGDA